MNKKVKEKIENELVLWTGLNEKDLEKIEPKEYREFIKHFQEEVLMKKEDFDKFNTDCDPKLDYNLFNKAFLFFVRQ